MSSKIKNTTGPAAPKGEVWVWFTSLGLVLGLSMVLVLFGLILFRGLSYFWPAPVTQIELREDSESALRGMTTFAGVLAKTQQRTERVLAETEEELDEEDAGALEMIPQTFTELHLFIGNRDAYGQSFRYFREDDIVARSYPDNIIRAERRSEGDGIFYPLRLQLDDGTEFDVSDEGFEAALRRVVREARSRRSEINRIERREIGRINLEINDIDLERRYLQRQEALTDSQERWLERLGERLQALQEDFAVHEAEANELRRENQANVLFFERSDGGQGRIAIGDLFRYYYPNQLGFFDRIGVFSIRFWEFVSGYPRDANMSGGIFPAIFGTFVMTLIMSVAVTPFGVIAAIYLREYAKQGPVVRSVRIAVNNLAGVPSIVFGVFGLGFFVYLMGGSIDALFFPRAAEMGTPTFGTGGILWAGLTLALLNLPVVIVATEESVSAVPRGVREGSLACGASKWQTMQRLVIPASLPGILTGMILAMARGAGEVAPLMLVGVVALAPNLPIDGNFPFIHLERKFMHLGFHIYDVGFQSPDSEAAIPTVFATTLVLIGLIVLLNLSAILLRNHIRKRHLGSAF